MGVGNSLPTPVSMMQDLVDLRREVDNLKLALRTAPSLRLRDLLDCRELGRSVNGNQPTYDTASGLWLPT